MQLNASAMNRGDGGGLVSDSAVTLWDATAAIRLDTTQTRFCSILRVPAQRTNEGLDFAQERRRFERRMLLNDFVAVPHV